MLKKIIGWPLTTTVFSISKIMIVMSTVLIAISMYIIMFFIDNLEPKLNPPPQIATILTTVKPINKMKMLNVVVKIEHMLGGGSGVIIYREYIVEDDLYVYYVISNEHVTNDRFISKLEVDGIRGRYQIITTDPGVIVTVFNNDDTYCTEYDAEVIVEEPLYDLALMKFTTQDYISDIAKLSDTEVVSDSKIFDPVYAVGCQLGELVIPTEGIISAFIDENDLSLIIHTAHILPGSSGGGLFKKYNGQYHLIGLPFAVRWYNFQIIPHYSYAISVEMIYRFLNDNDMSFIYESGLINEI